MKKIFYAALPYIIFTLVTMLVFSLFFGATYGLCILICLVTGKSATPGLLMYAFMVGGFAAGTFIAEEG